MCAVDSYQTGNQEEKRLSLVFVKLANVMSDDRQWAGFHNSVDIRKHFLRLVLKFVIYFPRVFDGKQCRQSRICTAVQFLAHQWNQYEAGPTYNPRQQYRGRAGGQMAEQNNARRHQPYQRAPQIPPQRTLQSFLDCIYPERVQWLGHPERQFALWTEEEEMEMVEGLRALSSSRLDRK
ncbi:hypothetical protein MIR68_002805 [Amoeboaphelidium protococcarum]|nr:hypothetical protein MIR68_002805 [Amoeboaphelidium protococcarum]